LPLSKKLFTKGLRGEINPARDLSKIEAGQLTLSLSDYSLKNVIQTVFGAVKPLAREKKISLKIDVAPGLPQEASTMGKFHSASSLATPKLSQSPCL
jgi:signal transduction histidine kinase